MNVFVTATGREILACDRETARREARCPVRYSHSVTTKPGPDWLKEMTELVKALDAKDRLAGQ